MSEIDTRNFFKFSSQFLSSTFQAYAIGLGNGENGKDNHWNLIKGIYQGIDFPIAFKQERGKKLTDILDTGWPSLYLVSNKMITVLKENFLTGWQSFPIRLYDKKENEMVGYCGFSVTGKSGATSYENCEIIEKRRVPNGPVCKFYKGVHINAWDGSDFFTPDGTYGIFITKKAANILMNNKITNLSLVNLADREVSVNDV